MAEPATGDRAAVQSLWDEHGAWLVVADRLKARVVRCRSLVLGLGVAGAFLQTLAISVDEASLANASAILGAAALALVPALSAAFLGQSQVRKWLRARSVSEGIKSEIYQFRSGAAPYDGPDALRRLTDKVRQIRGWAESLEVERARALAPPSPAPPPLDADAYVQRRVMQQVDDYYRPKAHANARLSSRFRAVEITLSIAAAALGSVAAGFGATADAAGTTTSGIGAWVAVLTTAAGAVAAHAAAGRYDFQAASFFATARQLADLHTDWVAAGRPTDAAAWSKFVEACEGTISSENHGWMAKLDTVERA